MPFRRESQGPPQAPPEQTVKVVYGGDSDAGKNYPRGEEDFFGIVNIGVDPSGTFLVLSKQRSSTFVKLADIDRIEAELQKVVA
jgi:hypothetical protein